MTAFTEFTVEAAALVQRLRDALARLNPALPERLGLKLGRT